MDKKHIAELLAVLDKSNFDDIELRDADLYLHVRRGKTERPAVVKPAAAKPTSGKVVKSPMVGIVHLLDDAKKSFVEVGQTVKAGTTLAQIESMKLFNDIKSPVEGTVAAIHVSDKQTVAYATPLFEITEAD